MIIAQSISTHYSRFENMGRFATLEKKWGPKYRVEKIGSGFFFVTQKEKRQLGLFSFRLQIASRKNMVQNLKKNRVDTTLYFLKFQTLKKYQVDLIN